MSAAGPGPIVVTASGHETGRALGLGLRKHAGAMKRLFPLFILFGSCFFVFQSINYDAPYFLIRSRGRHVDDTHSESRFKRAQSLMRVALEKAQRFDAKANSQDSIAERDEHVHNELIHEADLAARTLTKEKDHARKIELLRYL